ncbi:MAG: formate dehydrogenase subunit delta [Actinomycetes bacterium]
MSKDGLESLVRMVNQIAANVAHHSPEEAAELVAAHLRSFWAPPMRADILAYLDSGGGAGGAGLDPIAREGLELLRARTP